MILATLAAALALQTTPPRVWQGEEVSYLRRPMPEFPQGARANRAVVQLSCVVAPEGRFSRCEITDEGARGQGFGTAAVRAMRQAQIASGEGAPQPGDSVLASIAFWNGR